MRLDINDLICSFEDETSGVEKFQERMFAKPSQRSCFLRTWKEFDNRINQS